MQILFCKTLNCKDLIAIGGTDLVLLNDLSATILHYK